MPQFLKRFFFFSFLLFVIYDIFLFRSPVWAEEAKTVEIIVPKSGMVTTDFEIEHEATKEASFQTIVDDFFGGGDSVPPGETETQTGVQEKSLIEGELSIGEYPYPDLSKANSIIESALTKLLPNELNNQMTIKTVDNFSAETKHYVYGLYQDEEGRLIEDIVEPANAPYQDTKAPDWWQKIIGESKVACGIFGSCDAPDSLNIEIVSPVKTSAPPQKTGNQEKDKTDKSKIADTTIGNKYFSTFSFVKIITEKIISFFTEPFKSEDGSSGWALFKKDTTKTTIANEDEEGKTTLANKTRGTVPGLESIVEQFQFFRGFLPQEENEEISAPLATKVNYTVSEDYGLGNGSGELQYQNLGAAQRNYCLALCSQYPAGFPIENVDPLCPSCDPDDYELTGYGDIALNKDLCQRDGSGACHYYEKPNGANEGCGNGQDAFCEGGRCNPYEIGIDSDYNACGGSPYGSCVDEAVCYKMTFAANPSGGYGECQYANPTVCVRADRIQAGECAATCNWACCEWQEID